MNDILLLAAIAVLLVMVGLQQSWLQADAAFAELAMAQLADKIKQLQNELAAAQDFIFDDLRGDAGHCCTDSVERAMKREKTFDEEVGALFGEMPADFVTHEKAA